MATAKRGKPAKKSSSAQARTKASASSKKALKAAPKKSSKSRTAAGRQSQAQTGQAGSQYACDVCGLVVTVDNACGCVDTCDIICCGEQMHPQSRQMESRA